MEDYFFDIWALILPSSYSFFMDICADNLYLKIPKMEVIFSYMT